MSKIKKKAKKLAEAIASSDEFLAMKKAESKIDNDEHASEMVEEIENLQKKIDLDRTNEELKQEMASLQRKAWDNQKIKNFFQKQHEYSKMMKKVNDTISEALKSENSNDEQ
jgi:cell fate (sporulation/competence/biofilm development) regulator YlbF (YheA/YmcA/DUF963 family)